MEQSFNILKNGVSTALLLDSENKCEEAYVKYLECVYTIANKLLSDVQVPGAKVTINKEVIQYINLGQQCMERISDLINKLEKSTHPSSLKGTDSSQHGTASFGQQRVSQPGKAASGGSSPQSKDTGNQRVSLSDRVSPIKRLFLKSGRNVRQSGSGSERRLYSSLPSFPVSKDTINTASRPTMFSAPVPPLGSEATVAQQTRQKRLSPMEYAARYNEQMKSAYRARLAKMNEPARANLMMTLHRKLAENLAIAKAQEEILAKKMKERQLRLEDQAARRFSQIGPNGLSAEEKEHRQFYKKVLEFEQDEKKFGERRIQLEENPGDVTLLNQLIQDILHCKEHPLSQQLSNYQYKIYEKLYPLVANRMENVKQIRVPLPSDLHPPKQKQELSSIPESSDKAMAEPLTDPPESEKHSSFVENVSENRELQSGDGLVKVQSSDIQEKHTEEDDSACNHQIAGDTDEQCPSPKIESTDLQNLDEKENVELTTSSDDDYLEVNTEELSDKGGNSDDDSLEVHTEELSEMGGNSTDIKGDQYVMEEVCSSIREDLEMAVEEGTRTKLKLETENQNVKPPDFRTAAYEQYNVDNMDDLFDEEEEDTLLTEELSNLNDQSETTSEVSDQKQSESRASETDQTVTSNSHGDNIVDKCVDKSVPPTSFYWDIVENIGTLKNEAFHRHFKAIAEDVHNYLEKLLALFVVAYEQLDSPAARDQLNASLEEPFFKPIWQYLLTLLRLVNGVKEVQLAYIMTKLHGATPSDLNVHRKLCLDPCTGVDGDYPYKPAVVELRKLQVQYTFLSKLECLVKVSRLVCQCVEDFYSIPDADGHTLSSPSIGADDLLPILCYVVVKSGLPQLVSECHAMEEFIHEGYMMGEEGYCLTSMQTAVNYVISLGLL